MALSVDSVLGFVLQRGVQSYAYRVCRVKRRAPAATLRGSCTEYVSGLAVDTWRPRVDILWTFFFDYKLLYMKLDQL